MKSISKFAILLLLSLLTPTVSFSQDTYPKIVNDTLILLTSSQLKHTNLIFAEHKMLLNKVDLLESQIWQYKKLVSNYEYNDSLLSCIINTDREYFNSKINILNSEIKKSKKQNLIYKSGCVGFIGLLIYCLFK